MIPIFRAKKIDSDEYVNGQYLPTYKTERNEYGDNVDEEEVLHHYLIKSISNTETDDEDRFDFWGFEEIDSTTLAIHFPDMLDSQGNKIFASLSEDGKGGDIVEVCSQLKNEYKRGFKAICKYESYGRFYAKRIANFAENWALCWVKRNTKVIGIQE